MSGEVQLATGLTVRGGMLLLVASAYPSHEQPLWNLPGGRQRAGELLRDTLEREVREETGLKAGIADLAYVSESYDGDLHVINTTFEMSVSGTLCIPTSGDHIVGARWCAIADIETLIAVDVVRLPLLHYLHYGRRYRGFAEAGITIRWPEDGT